MGLSVGTAGWCVRENDAGRSSQVEVEDQGDRPPNSRENKARIYERLSRNTGVR